MLLEQQLQQLQQQQQWILQQQQRQNPHGPGNLAAPAQSGQGTGGKDKSKGKGKGKGQQWGTWDYTKGAKGKGDVKGKLYMPEGGLEMEQGSQVEGSFHPITEMSLTKPQITSQKS